MNPLSTPDPFDQERIRMPDWRRCDKGKVEGGDREERKMAANRGALLPSYKEAL